LPNKNTKGFRWLAQRKALLGALAGRLSKKLVETNDKLLWTKCSALTLLLLPYTQYSGIKPESIHN
jgi:hypothetical protein